MIFYNGSTGGLGSYFGAAAGGRGMAVRARLDDPEGLRRELQQAWKGSGEREVALVQMAARVSVPECERDPSAAHRINVVETCAFVGAFLEWAVGNGLAARIVYVSTGHVYAALSPGRQANESDETAPRSVYARTKLLAEQRIAELCAAQSASLRIARVFGLIAPRQPAHYVLPSLVQRAHEGRVREIPGLDYSRDYLDSRDVCECLVALADAQDTWRQEVMNVCSGRPVTIREVLAEVLTQMRPGDARALLDQATAAPGRPDDVAWIVGDPSRYVSRFGREPRRIALRQTIADAFHVR